MKHLYILSLFTLALCLTTTLSAQEKAAPEVEKQVIIIKKTVNSDGTVTTEKTITSGADGEEVIVAGDSDGKMIWVTSDDSEEITEKNIEVIVEGSEGGKVFTIVTSGDAESGVLQEIEVTSDGDAGEHTVWVTSGNAEGVVMKNIEVNVEEDEDGKVITIVSDGQTEVIELAPGVELSDEKKAELAEKGVHVIDHNAVIDGHEEHAIFFSNDNPDIAKKIHVLTEKLTDFNFNFDFDFDHNVNIAHVSGGGANCVALGVFVDSDRNGGVNIQSIIDGSGAQDAGMEAGDVIHVIGEDPVENFRALHVALSNYEPGEVVTVEFERDGVRKTVEAELRAWGDLPNYENSWRAQVKCGEENTIESPKVTKRIIIIKKNNDAPPVTEEVVRDPVSTVYSPNDFDLNLENFTTFPNPTDGKFHVQFEAEAKPITVSVFDVTGKEIYRDNVKNFDGYYNKEIDLRGMSIGTLILSIAQDGKRHS
ncbi:MAG: hypothetical protein DRQ89_15290, partial [Epsilonproteobacteria bacterium]